MSDLLEYLQETTDPDSSKIAKVMGISVDEVRSQLDALVADGSLLGWVPLVHPSKKDNVQVRAVIEVKISPEREGGFDRLAHRISKFDEVEACHLMSGAYDLLVIVQGNNLHTVATFVSERLATIDGVLSIETHFLLRSYRALPPSHA